MINMHYQPSTDMSSSVSPAEPWPWAQSGEQSRCGRLPPSLRELQAPVGWSPLAQSWLQHHKHWIYSILNIWIFSKTKLKCAIHNPVLSPQCQGLLYGCSSVQRFSTFLTPKCQTVRQYLKVPKTTNFHFFFFF